MLQTRKRVAAKAQTHSIKRKLLRTRKRKPMLRQKRKLMKRQKRKPMLR
jgi:hypothetical protein